MRAESNKPCYHFNMTYNSQAVHQFASFWEKAGKDSIQLPSDIPEIQALFLGIKPACLHNEFALQNANILKEYGIEFIGRIAYRKDKVEEVLKAHPDIFHGQSNVHEFMTQHEIWEQDNIQLGLILGYPLEAAQQMKRWAYLMTKAPKILETQQEINTLQTTKKEMDAYDICWMSFGDRESEELQHSLRDIFEKSGILKITEKYIAENFSI